MFIGFLPPKQAARRQKLTSLTGVASTLILYEAPHRIDESLADIYEVLGNREVCVARELTKIHEEFLFGPLSEVKTRVKALGEFVIVISGATEPPRELPLTRDAVLQKLGITRNQLYDLFFKK